jgi:20S proteasome subunit alpha 7
MTSIGTGYDLSVQTYSPDGRIFQVNLTFPDYFDYSLNSHEKVEYAAKCSQAAGTAIGLRTKHGVVLAVEKMVLSKLMVKGKNGRIARVDKSIGIVSEWDWMDLSACSPQSNLLILHTLSFTILGGYRLLC